MRKLVKRVLYCFLLVVLVWCGTLIADRQRLNEELVRLHVVAASDSAQDQRWKLLVRDAVVDSLTEELKNVADGSQARAYLEENLPKIREKAVSVLRLAGCQDPVEVSLEEEAFDTRNYDNFSLPAGIYDTLRVTIGQGAGENWWCVVFPAFCGGTGEPFDGVAEAAGFPESLSGALTEKDGYGIRFFLLEVLGKLENLLHGE